MTILLTDNELSKNTLLSGNIDKDKLRQCILDAQSERLEVLLGEKLYEKICADYDTNALSGDYATLYTDYIKPFLIRQSVFEKDEKARKILSKLVNVTQVTTITATNDYYNGYKVDLTGITPTILYNLSEECILESTYPSTVLIKPVTLDAYAANVDNPFKKPWKNLIWRLDVGDGTQQVILISTDTVLAYNLTYLRQPETIDVTSNSSILINEEAHNDIVSGAVQLALQALQINNNLKQSK